MNASGCWAAGGWELLRWRRRFTASFSRTKQATAALGRRCAEIRKARKCGARPGVSQALHIWCFDSSRTHLVQRDGVLANFSCLRWKPTRSRQKTTGAGRAQYPAALGSTALEKKQEFVGSACSF